MTPLARFYTRFLPARFVWLALAFSYALGLGLVFMFAGHSMEDVIYIDIGGRN